ncbi:unnamed protein product [Phaedon cochleariae]|uniref:Uncharacterized protein n=1 Tax=Phaedon cochleariae TaxID=80249 RepID=A0A9N9SGR1_PHACE|nr:unnamed protein product [Phaedon cochleariae]
MSRNGPQAIEPAPAPPENNHAGGPFVNANRLLNNNNRSPLVNFRDRLFHTLFYRAALAYARTFPRPLRRFIEFIILIKALTAFFVLVYIHIAFSRTPSSCLMHIKDSWPRDGILRVEIIRNAGKDYNIEQSYAKEEKLKQQGKVEDFVHVIGLLARDSFINIEPTAVEDINKETEPLKSDYTNSTSSLFAPVDEKIIADALVNVSKISPTIWKDYEMLTEYPLGLNERSSMPEHIIDRTENDANVTQKVGVEEIKEEIQDINKMRTFPDDEYIIEFSLEYGFLRLSPATRARLKIPVEIVTLDPAKDACFGDAFSRLVLDEFLGYDDLLLASIKTLAEKEENKGYLR